MGNFRFMFLAVVIAYRMIQARLVYVGGNQQHSQSVPCGMILSTWMASRLKTFRMASPIYALLH